MSDSTFKPFKIETRTCEAKHPDEAQVLVNIEDLRNLEWCIERDREHGTYSFCPVCGNGKLYAGGHESDCWLGKAIGAKRDGI